MPQPYLFKLNTLRLASNPRSRLGAPPPMRGYLPLPTFHLYITGITKDSAGTALGSCVVQLFRTDNDQIIEEIVSDGAGEYRFRGIAPGTSYYVVAYKAGAPDVAGTTVNTLVGANA